MARASIDKPYSTFVGGLVTEATGVSFPENTAREATNVDFNKSGLVQRRLGLTSEIDETVVATGINAYDGSQAQTCYLWRAPTSSDIKQFLVTQIGNILQFYNAQNDAVLDTATLSGIIDETVLLNGTPASGNSISIETLVPLDEAGSRVFTAVEQEKFPLQYAEVNGYLVVVGAGINPLVIRYDEDDAAIYLNTVRNRTSQTPGTYFLAQYRDFQGIDDGTTNDNFPSTLTEEHLYNLLNSGWKEADLQAYFTANSLWPARSIDWKAGKDANNSFSVSEVNKVDFGNSPAPKGRKLIELSGGGSRSYTFDSGTLTGASFSSPVNLSSTSVDHYRNEMPITCVGYAGRLFVSGDVCPNHPNAVYFSKVVQKESDLGVFYQEADPTSEGISDLIDSDGGVLFIPEAGRIRKLTALGDGIAVFADNGVWYIRGADEGFRATVYAVDKLASESVVSPYSVVEVDNAVFFWSKSGIYVVDTSGSVSKLSDKIESLYAEIRDAQLATAWGSYDLYNRKVVWSYADRTIAEAGEKGKLNVFLIYDIVTQSFTTYSVDPYEGVLGAATTSAPGPHFVPFKQPLISYQDPSALPSLSIVRSTEERVVNLSVKLLCSSDDGANTVSHQIMEFSNVNFRDWVGFYDPIGAVYDTDGEAFTSRLITGEEVFGAPQVDKSVRYVHSYFNRTENGAITISADPLEVEYVVPSGCQMKVFYDFHRGALSPRATRPQQAYRPRRGLPVTIGASVGATATLTNTDSVVYSKLKARGHGRAISIQYESEDGKDFQLLGFAVQAAGNTL